MCCTGVCHVAARSSVVVRTQKSEKVREQYQYKTQLDNKSRLEERRVPVGSCSFNVLVR